ncbi:hypothetical protein REPUB_Repub04eG0190000 [Reevesia pubescens]
MKLRVSKALLLEEHKSSDYDLYKGSPILSPAPATAKPGTCMVIAHRCFKIFAKRTTFKRNRNSLVWEQRLKSVMDAAQDFGLLKAFKLESGSGVTTNHVCGTVRYLDPEQVILFFIECLLTIRRLSYIDPE